jgi:hypothetical protein
MKISEIITDKYKLRMPPTVYYELLADVVEVEEEQEPKTGHWKPYLKEGLRYQCSACDSRVTIPFEYCPHCGAKMVAPQESEDCE